MPFWSSFSFQDSNSPILEFLVFFHDILIILILILITNILSISNMIFFLKYSSYASPESQSLEDFWLMVPMIFLFFIGFPSIKNLYLYEEFSECDISMKVVGFQWYWMYELNNVNLSSYLNNEEYFFRLLETYNHLVLPIKCIIRLMVTSNDVIHSWTVPSLGVKLDATPGRLSQVIMMINRPGMLVGQCSEICGANHSFMPITISANSLKNLL